MTSASGHIIMGVVFLATMLAGIAALVLFIVGVVTKKAGLWVAGLAIGVVAMTAVAGFFVLAVFSARQATNAWVQNQWSQLPASSGGPLGSPVTTNDDLRAWFSEATGVELPQDVELLESQVGIRLSDAGNDPFPATIRHMKLSVPAAFVESLGPDFKEVAWEYVADHFAALPAGQAVATAAPSRPGDFSLKPAWTDAEVQGLSYYAYEPAETAPITSIVSHAVYVACDKDFAVAYVAAEEKNNIGSLPSLTGNGPRTGRSVRYAPAGGQEAER